MMDSLVVHPSPCGGDQGWLSGTFTEVKARRPRLVLGGMTTREDQVL